MKVIMSKKALFCTFLYVLVISIFNIVIFSVDVDAYHGLSMVGYFCFVEIILFMIINAIVMGRFLSFSIIFVLVLFLFNFGQLMIYVFFANIYHQVRFLLLLSAEEAFYGYKYINLAFSMFTIGILIAGVKTLNISIPNKDLFFNKKYNFERVAKDVIIVTFPIKVIVDLCTLFILVIRGGVAARVWINSFPNILIYFGKVSLIGFALLLLIYKDYPVKQKRVFIFIEIYILTMMVSGIRSENVSYVLVFMFLYLANRKEKLKIRYILLYVILIFFGLSFIVAIGKFRNSNIRNITALSDLFIDTFSKNNMILSLFDTCGDTGYTAQCVLSKWLPFYGPSYGDAYYRGWVSIIPNVAGIFTLPGTITADSYFARRLQTHGALSNSYLNIGGSIIGEQFFNFGLIGGVIACAIIGFLIGRISYKGTYYMEVNNYFGMIKIIPMMFATIYWVRDYFGGGFREVIWGPIICLLVIWAFRRYSQEEKMIDKITIKE